ncbi:hypothetical protein [Methylobacterium sp. C1]|uniref:hypothetical protein n=1 Tax=Methylobacterium sp. C1 TaxID=1479019 RepID=UPI0013319CA0|nr:hypothetical protein [Methylobacterium sp. C1]
MKQAKPKGAAKSYYVKLFRRAFAEAFAAIGLTKSTEAFRSLVLWSGTVLLLYSIGWSRIPFIGTENPDASSEVRLGLSAVGAIVLIFVVTLIWRLLSLPPRLDAELRAEVAAYKAEMETDADVERELLTLSQMRREGLDLYDNIKDASDEEEFHAWRAALDAWVQRVKDRLDERWSVAARHEFDDAGRSGGWTRRMKNEAAQAAIEQRNTWLLSRYTSYFASLDDLVRRGYSLFIGPASVRMARAEEDDAE